uniref:Protein kinase domain-containing protein n=1 Tax=Chrysotila carterae TaxID=13221 RepID=A0A7S4BAR6_CHRCT
MAAADGSEAEEAEEDCTTAEMEESAKQSREQHKLDDAVEGCALECHERQPGVQVTEAECMKAMELLSKEKLGEGGYGVVLRGEWRGSICAVKRLCKVSLNEQQLQREIQAHMQVQQGSRSPHVVELLAQYEKAEAHFLFLEFCPLGDLLDLVIDCGGLSEAQSRTLFTQLLSALRHCHDFGVAHRDVKLDNLLMASCERLKVCDFGLAACTEPGASGCLCAGFAGTPRYAAPEGYYAHKYDAFLADAWSCGVCLFTMLCNMAPFAEATAADWQFEMLCDCERSGRCFVDEVHAELELSCALSAEAKQLLNGLLHPFPNERSSIAAAAESAWVLKKCSKDVKNGTLFLDRAWPLHELFEKAPAQFEEGSFARSRSWLSPDGACTSSFQRRDSRLAETFPTFGAHADEIEREMNEIEREVEPPLWRSCDGTAAVSRRALAPCRQAARTLR